MLNKAFLTNLQEAIASCLRVENTRDAANALVLHLFEGERTSGLSESELRDLQRRTGSSDSRKELAETMRTAWAMVNGDAPSAPTVTNYTHAAAAALLGIIKTPTWDAIKNYASKCSNRKIDPYTGEPRNPKADDPKAPSKPDVSGITEPDGFWVLSISKNASPEERVRLILAFAEKTETAL